MPKIRPFLKWAGGKYSSLAQILPHLPETNTFIEPCIGSGAIFLNSHYKKYLLNDINPDVINLYQVLQRHGQSFVDDVKTHFVKKNNNKKRYYQLRDYFNDLEDTYERACLFIYLNRHGYNGLCRYNSQGYYNVPFGRYKAPFVPEENMLAFHEKAQRATFICGDFAKAFARARKGAVIYCDPPYVPLSKTANFTNYSQSNFSLEQQEQLVALAKAAAARGVTTLISNHNTPYTRKLYRGNIIATYAVQRTISRDISKRQPAMELLVGYGL